MYILSAVVYFFLLSDIRSRGAGYPKHSQVPHPAPGGGEEAVEETVHSPGGRGGQERDQQHDERGDYAQTRRKD